MEDIGAPTSPLTRYSYEQLREMAWADSPEQIAETARRWVMVADTLRARARFLERAAELMRPIWQSPAGELYIAHMTRLAERLRESADVAMANAPVLRTVRDRLQEVQNLFSDLDREPSTQEPQLAPRPGESVYVPNGHFADPRYRRALDAMIALEQAHYDARLQLQNPAALIVRNPDNFEREQTNNRTTNSFNDSGNNTFSTVPSYNNGSASPSGGSTGTNPIATDVPGSGDSWNNDGWTDSDGPILSGGSPPPGVTAPPVGTIPPPTLGGGGVPGSPGTPPLAPGLPFPPGGATVPPHTPPHSPPPGVAPISRGPGGSGLFGTPRIGGRPGLPIGGVIGGTQPPGGNSLPSAPMAPPRSGTPTPLAGSETTSTGPTGARQPGQGSPVGPYPPGGAPLVDDGRRRGRRSRLTEDPAVWRDEKTPRTRGVLGQNRVPARTGRPKPPERRPVEPPPPTNQLGAPDPCRDNADFGAGYRDRNGQVVSFRRTPRGQG